MAYKLCKGTEELQSVHVQNSVSHGEKELILEGDKLLREIIRSWAAYSLIRLARRHLHPAWVLNKLKTISTLRETNFTSIIRNVASIIGVQSLCLHIIISCFALY
jgi:hypothetical protein